MAAEWLRRVFFLSVVILQCVLAQEKYSIPDVTIEVLSPKGFRASIPDFPKLTLFVFQGNVNRDINRDSVGTIKGEVLRATNGRWVFEDTNTELKVGDIINYYVFVSVNRVGYLKDNLSYTVSVLGSRFGDGTTPTERNGAEQSTGTIPTDCRPTVTQVRGGRPCSGQIIFEDNFETIRGDLWQIEQYIPLSHPEFPFVTYQRLQSNPVVSVTNGYLSIKPQLQQYIQRFNNESIYLGSVDLFSGCTSRAEECYRQASGPDILPPIVSGRITTSGFAFAYGTVYIRAKLPQGDWLYPEILLEPFLKKYGSSNYASGVVKIATARGNKVLRAGSDDYGNKVLYGGPIMDFQCRKQLLSNKYLDGRLWGDDFHEFTVSWTPQYLAFSVDGEEWARVEAGTGLRERIPHHCSHLPRALLTKGTLMAPFDDFFYITLGVAAGGISEFRDDVVTSNSRPKPWRNSGRKAMLNFWEDLPNWESTWTQPELLVDYVKVVAL